MWWLDDDFCDPNAQANWRILRGGRRFKFPTIRPTNRGQTSLSASETEANKRLLEAGILDESLATNQRPDAESPCVSEAALRNRVAEIKRQYEARIEQLRRVACTKVQELNRQLSKARHSIGDQAQNREFARVQLARLRKLLLEAEQRAVESQQQIAEMRSEIDVRVTEAKTQAFAQQQDYETECKYLKSMNTDLERRAEKLETTVKTLREYTRRLVASHQTQLNETRCRGKTDLDVVVAQLSESQQEQEKLREDLVAEQQRTQELERTQERQTQQIISLTQQCQIAEHVIRQTKRDQETSDGQHSATQSSSRAA